MYMQVFDSDTACNLVPVPVVEGAKMDIIK